MRVGGLEETITVVGGSPIIDTKTVTQQRTVSRDVMDSLPTAKTFGSLGALIPGVTVSRPDVGGSSGDLGTSLSIHGSRTGDSQILVDGMSVANGLGAGSYGHFFNNGMLQEISVETGGMLAENDAAGVRSNLIPREGGDTFKGSLSGNYTNGSLNSRNTSDELTALGPPDQLRGPHLRLQSVARWPGRAGEAVVLPVVSRLGVAHDPRRQLRRLSQPRSRGPVLHAGPVASGRSTPRCIATPTAG